MLFSFFFQNLLAPAALRQDAEKPSAPELRSLSALSNVAERGASVKFFDAAKTLPA